MNNPDLENPSENSGLNDNVLDIKSSFEYPSNVLSNFYGNEFIFEDVTCKSMEGFLQSLKYKSGVKQKKICLLVGKEAKKKGKRKFLWKLTGVIHWKGKKIKRNSPEFDNLILRAYKEMYKQSTEFKTALLSTKKYTLVHTIGKHDKRKTILTEEEFIYLLNLLRSQE